MKAIKICFDVIKRKTKQKILTATITLNRLETGHRSRTQVSLLSLNKYSILLFKYKHKLNVSYFLFEYKYQWMRVIKPWKRLKSSVMGVNKKRKQRSISSQSWRKHQPGSVVFARFCFVYIVIINKIYFLTFEM